MEALDKEFSVLSQALRQNGFYEVDKFGSFVTFVRDGDPLKFHLGPDGSFSVFNIADECITEGKGAEDLYGVLVAKAGAAHRGPVERAGSWSGAQMCRQVGKRPWPRRTDSATATPWARQK
jgi:hypothetical protein